jgi:hypothetical protein
MNIMRAVLLAGVFFGQFAASPDVGHTQISQPWQSRIPKPDPGKYRSTRDARDWKNPYLVVRRDGIEIVGTTPAGQSIDVSSIPAALEKLPASAWPYGLVVAIQDIGLVSGKDPERIADNRTKLMKLMKLMKDLGIVVDLWPSA